MSKKRHFRISPRPQLTCRVKVLRLDTPQKTQIVSFTKDLGVGGLFLEDDNNLNKNEHLEVTLSTPSTWEPITLKAEVVWAFPAIEGEPTGGAGLRFVDMTSKETTALNNFVQSLDYDG